MLGLILAAGLSKRMRPLTNHVPKCLLRIMPNGMTFLDYQIVVGVMHGVKTFVIVGGYRVGAVREFIHSRQYSDEADIHIVFNPDYDSKNI